MYRASGLFHRFTDTLLAFPTTLAALATIARIECLHLPTGGTASSRVRRSLIHHRYQQVVITTSFKSIMVKSWIEFSVYIKCVQVSAIQTDRLSGPHQSSLSILALPRLVEQLDIETISVGHPLLLDYK
jgi:hypothetical protein